MALVAKTDDSLELIRFAIVEYGFARKLQQYLVRRRIADEIADTIICCQHYSVVTLGKRLAKSSVEFLAESERLRDFSIYETDRGGLITAHNPGQLVLYPVVNLRRRKMGVKRFVSLGLEAIAATFQLYNVDAYSLEEPAGVFVDVAGGRKKLGYVGLKIVKGVTDHGFSVNIDNDLEIFRSINSCGLPAGEVSSLAEHLNGVKVQDFAAKLLPELAKKLGQ